MPSFIVAFAFSAVFAPLRETAFVHLHYCTAFAFSVVRGLSSVVRRRLCLFRGPWSVVRRPSSPLPFPWSVVCRPSSPLPFPSSLLTRL